MKCKSLLVVVLLGLPTCQDAERSVQQDCDSGDMQGCTDLGVMYATGAGVTRDDARAVSLYQRACDGGEMRGCFNLGLIYRTGAGVTRDDARARSLYRQACDGGLPEACTRE